MRASTLTKVSTTALRAAFAARLSQLYGTEVPAYNVLVETSHKVNRRVLQQNGSDAERLGSIDRVTAERHGAIRVGSVREMRQVARIFAALGMFPCGFYDLRGAQPTPIPVVSTAFRPLDRKELAANPFRVFTSMLVPGRGSPLLRARPRATPQALPRDSRTVPGRAYESGRPRRRAR